MGINRLKITTRTPASHLRPIRSPTIVLSSQQVLLPSTLRSSIILTSHRVHLPPPQGTSKPYNQAETQENTRGDLARGLLLLLTLAIGGILVFVGLGRLDGTVLTQSIFPSLVALAGTALGFYFGSQTAKESDSSQRAGTNGSSASTGSTPPGNTGGAGQQKTGG